MSMKSPLLLVAAVSFCPIVQGEEERHLFILSGQSNMAGLDPKESFTPTVEELFGPNHVIVVKDGRTARIRAFGGRCAATEFRGTPTRATSPH